MEAPSYEVQLDRVNALLDEWGECQRREPSPRVQGYPSSSVEGRMMEDYGYRTDKSRRWAWTGKGRAQRQTQVRVVKTGGQWPEHIQRVDRILARLDTKTKWAVVWTYISGKSLRQVAVGMGSSKDDIARRLDRARWFLLGALEEVDA